METGLSSQEHVRGTLGDPTEIQEDGTVWLYSAKSLDAPFAVSLLPVIGDLIEVADWVDKARGRYEWIVQFDQAGVARRISKRQED